jgi:hypothetical protein
MKEKEIKKKVREGYTDIIKNKKSCCDSISSCCGYSDQINKFSRNIGYTENELKSIPEEANLGLGCGNPIALASLQQGEIVLDFGSGAG